MTLIMMEVVEARAIASDNGDVGVRLVFEPVAEVWMAKRVN